MLEGKVAPMKVVCKKWVESKNKEEMGTNRECEWGSKFSS